MKHNAVVKIPCPFEGCSNILIIDIYFGHRGSFEDPPEGPCINDVRGCEHHIDDDTLIDLALSQAADDEEAAYERFINARIDEARGK